MILGILLTITLLVLFAPIRYRISAVFPEKNITAKFMWLAGTVSLVIRYPAVDDSNYRLKILGIPFNWLIRSYKKKDKQNGDADRTNNKSAASSDTVACNKSDEDELTECELSESSNEQSAKKKNRFDTAKAKIKKIRNSLKNVFSNIKEPDNIAAVKVIKDRLIILLKHLKPKKIYANIVIGTGDPCNTGLLFGLISILMGIWPGDYTFVPDFDNKVIEGRIYCKGKVRVSVFIYNILKIIFDDTVKKAWNNTSKAKRRKTRNGGNG